MNNEPTLVDAIFSLTGTYDDFNIIADDVIWHDEAPTKHTNTTLNTELVRLKAEYNKLEYSRNRKKEYDQLNQFELMFDDKKNGTNTWSEEVQKIRDRYSKPV